MNSTWGQTAAQKASRTVFLLAVVVWIGASAANGHSTEVSDQEAERILREIKDPHTGETWLLFQNASDPAGPGRLIMSDLNGNQKRVQAKPVIRVGDRVLVEEHGATIDAYLEATALEPAQTGSHVNLRLRIGGKVIRAVAVAPGRAEVRP